MKQVWIVVCEHQSLNSHHMEKEVCVIHGQRNRNNMEFSKTGKADGLHKEVRLGREEERETWVKGTAKIGLQRHQCLVIDSRRSKRRYAI